MGLSGLGWWWYCGGREERVGGFGGKGSMLKGSQSFEFTDTPNEQCSFGSVGSREPATERIYVLDRLYDGVQEKEKSR